MITIGKLPQTPRAKKVIERATEEAKSLNHIGTEHLLLGLLREQGGIATNVLTTIFGLKLDAVRERIRELSRASTDKPPDKPMSFKSSRFVELGSMVIAVDQISRMYERRTTAGEMMAAVDLKTGETHSCNIPYQEAVQKLMEHCP